MTAAKNTLETLQFSAKEEHVALMETNLNRYMARFGASAQALSYEMDAPIGFAREWQTGIGEWHIEATFDAQKKMGFTEKRGITLIAREPFGDCALITRWNRPLNRTICKVSGCLVHGDPKDANTMGALVRVVPFEKDQSLIEKGIAESVTLTCDGIGRQEELNYGNFVFPTVFESVTNAECVANDTVYVLATYMQGSATCNMATAGKQGAPERPDSGPPGAFRRLQKIRKRPRICRPSLAPYPWNQGFYRVGMTIPPWQDDACCGGTVALALMSTGSGKKFNSMPPKVVTNLNATAPSREAHRAQPAPKT